MTTIKPADLKTYAETSKRKIVVASWMRADCIAAGLVEGQDFVVSDDAVAKAKQSEAVRLEASAKEAVFESQVPIVGQNRHERRRTMAGLRKSLKSPTRSRRGATHG